MLDFRLDHNPVVKMLKRKVQRNGLETKMWDTQSSAQLANSQTYKMQLFWDSIQKKDNEVMVESVPSRS
jgi:predicted AlkP superfamily phosphohydrolase/phosphomutase